MKGRGEWERGGGGWFDRLAVRRKLMVLHNLFFLILVLSLYLVLRLPGAHLTVGGALVVVYVLAVAALEALILPRYVYGPIQRLLAADAALQQGKRDEELIDPRFISRDELGQLMSSRNRTVTLLRQRERELTDALARLEETAADLKRKNHLLETAQQNLASQDRLVSLGMLSAGVAHELNTPLAVLHGSIEKLLEAPGEAAGRERLARMLRVTERLRGISESLVDFARARTQQMGPVRVGPLLDEAWSLVGLEPEARRVSFENGVAGDDEVFGNADRLLQVFVNLLRNAVDALGSSGKVIVRARRVTQDRRPWLVVSVADNGPGIRPDLLPRLFEPFVTSRLDARGTGLGLAVAEGIVHQHGGVIVASNRPEGGACFEVTLPGVEPES